MGRSKWIETVCLFSTNEFNRRGAKSGEGEFRRFVDISIGSCAEVEYQLELCHDLKYLSDQDYEELAENYQSIGKMLNRLMQKLITKK